MPGGEWVAYPSCLVTSFMVNARIENKQYSATGKKSSPANDHLDCIFKRRLRVSNSRSCSNHVVIQHGRGEEENFEEGAILFAAITAP
jgi:hypothetical protein